MTFLGVSLVSLAGGRVHNACVVALHELYYAQQLQCGNALIWTAWGWAEVVMAGFVESIVDWLGLEENIRGRVLGKGNRQRETGVRREVGDIYTRSQGEGNI